MIQPKGTRTYKGKRSSRPGQESFEKDEKLLKKSEALHKSGKETEAKAKNKKTAAPVADSEEKK